MGRPSMGLTLRIGLVGVFALGMAIFFTYLTFIAFVPNPIADALPLVGFFLLVWAVLLLLGLAAVRQESRQLL